jgi:hypothetical protein
VSCLLAVVVSGSMRPPTDPLRGPRAAGSTLWAGRRGEELGARRATDREQSHAMWEGALVGCRICRHSIIMLSVACTDGSDGPEGP